MLYQYLVTLIAELGLRNSVIGMVIYSKNLCNLPMNCIFLVMHVYVYKQSNIRTQVLPYMGSDGHVLEVNINSVDRRLLLDIDLLKTRHKLLTS